MENLFALVIVISVFLSLLVGVAYVSDVVARKLVEWLRLEDIANSGF